MAKTELGESGEDEEWEQQLYINRSSHGKCSLEKGVLKSFAKFTGKHLCQSLFLIRL